MQRTSARLAYAPSRLLSAHKRGSRSAATTCRCQAVERLEPRTLLASGILDRSFGGGDGFTATDFGGGTDEAYAVAVLPDGKIVAVGSAGRQTIDFGVARYNADGTPDASFGSGGKVTTDFHGLDDGARAVAVQPNGKVVAAGWADRRVSDDQTNRNVALARYNPDGSLDRTFHSDGKLTADLGGRDEAAAVLIMPDGDVLVVGNKFDEDSYGYASERDVVAIRYNADGSRDRSFAGGDGILVIAAGDDTDARAGDAALVAGNKLLIGGSSGPADEGDIALWRLNSDGSPDRTFGGDGFVTFDAGRDELVNDIEVLADGDVLVGGATGYSSYYSSGYDVAIARFNADGTPDRAFAGDGLVTMDAAEGARDLAVLPDGKILVALDSGGVARFNRDGTVDTSFDGRDGVHDLGTISPAALAIQAGKPVVVGSGFQGDTPDFVVARLKNVNAGDDDRDDQTTEAPLIGLGQTRSGSIDPGTDVDLYRFTAADGQRIELDVDLPAGSGLDPRLRVFDADGRPITESDDAAAPGERAGTLESYVVQVFDEGTYYVGVSASGNGDYHVGGGTGDVAGEGGAYRLTVRELPFPADRDDQISEAPALAVGTARSGAIENPTDVDLVKITAAAGQQLAIDLDVAAEGGVNSMLRLFNARGEELASNANRSAPGEQENESEAYLEFTFTEAGTYYLGISGEANSGYNPVTGRRDVEGQTGSYTVTVTPVTPDRDDQIAEAATLRVGAARGGSINPSGDVDMYRFDARGGRPFAIDLDRADRSNLNGRLRLFSASGQELASSAGEPAPDETNAPGEAYLEFLPTASGPVYVGVSGENNYSYNAVTGADDNRDAIKGGYTLAVTELPRDDDDQVAEARRLALGGTATGEIRPGTDVDLYRVEIAAGQVVTFDLDSTGPGTRGGPFDSFLRLFGPDGSEFASSDNDAAPGENAEGIVESYLEFEPSEGGVFYVGVSGAGNWGYEPTTGLRDRTGDAGRYRLTATLLQAPPDDDDQLSEAARITIGTAAAGELTDWDVDMYRFSATDGQTLTISAEQSNVDAYLRLFDAEGTELSSSDGDIEYAFENGGTYFVGVSGFINGQYDPLTGDGDVRGSKGRYELIIRRSGGTLNPPDSDDQVSEASPAPAQRQAGAIDPSGDVDMFRLVAAAGQEFFFDFQPTEGSVRLRLFDAQGRELREHPDGSFGFRFESAGTYYVGVSQSDNASYDPVSGEGDSDSGTARYALAVVPMAADRDDQVSEATPLSVGSARSGAIADPLDVDVFAVRVSAGQRVGFDLDVPNGGDFDSYLRLFDADGNQLLANDDANAPGEADEFGSYLEYLFQSGGTYYVAVSGMPNTGYDVRTGAGDAPGSTGDYTLRVSSPPSVG